MRACATTLESELTDEELEALVGLLERSKLSGPHLEIGTAAGGTLCRMMRAYPDECRPRFVVVDPMTYFENQMATVRANLERHGLSSDAVSFKIGKSHQLYDSAKRAGERYDFIFIDGAHKFRYVTMDLSWSGLLNPGGLLLLHDYDPRFQGVVMAADRFLRRNRHYVEEERIGSLLIVRKISASPRPEVSRGDVIFAQVLTPLLQVRDNIANILSR